MLRRLLVIVAMVAGMLLGSTAAHATCQPGTVEIKPKPRIELPECHPPG